MISVFFVYVCAVTIAFVVYSDAALPRAEVSHAAVSDPATMDVIEALAGKAGPLEESSHLQEWPARFLLMRLTSAASYWSSNFADSTVRTSD